MTPHRSDVLSAVIFRLVSAGEASVSIKVTCFVYSTSLFICKVRFHYTLSHFAFTDTQTCVSTPHIFKTDSLLQFLMHLIIFSIARLPNIKTDFN